MQYNKTTKKYKVIFNTGKVIEVQATSPNQAEREAQRYYSFSKKDIKISQVILNTD